MVEALAVCCNTSPFWNLVPDLSLSLFLCLCARVSTHPLPWIHSSESPSSSRENSARIASAIVCQRDEVYRPQSKSQSTPAARLSIARFISVPASFLQHKANEIRRDFKPRNYYHDNGRGDAASRRRRLSHERRSTTGSRYAPMIMSMT